MPAILLMGKDWNPTEEVLRPSHLSKGDIKMRTIRLLSTQQINTVCGTNVKTGIERHGEVKAELTKISGVYNEREFYSQLISAVNIATTYQEDVDWWEDEHKACSVIMKERESNRNLKTLVID